MLSVSKQRLHEPLLDVPDTYSLRPFKYEHIYKFYRNARLGNWELEETPLSQDVSDYLTKLNDPERNTLDLVLAFFNQADGLVAENAVVNMYSKVMVPEVRLYYGYQISIEGVHADVYSTLITKLVPDPTRRAHLINTVSKLGCVAKKTEWCKRWMNNNIDFEKRLFAFAITEGVFFSASFCVVFWLKKRGLMPALCFWNEKINRDENEHCDFAALLYALLLNVLTYEIAIEILEPGMECEDDFIDALFPEPLNGINAEYMKVYSRFCADKVLVAFGFQPYYKVSNPFEWMEMLGLRSKTNFFEKKSAEYNKGEKKDETKETGFVISDEF